MRATDAILGRRSVRKFEERPVEDEKLELLLRAAMQAPSAKNERPWEFVVIRDREMLVRLSQTDPYALSMKNAPVGIVLLCNKARYLPEGDAFWQQDMAAAAENLLIAARDLELGATWLAIAPLPERMDYVREALALPEGVDPFCMMPVGYPLRPSTPQDRYDTARLYHETYRTGQEDQEDFWTRERGTA